MLGLILMKMGGKSSGDEVAFQQGQHVLYFTTVSRFSYYTRFPFSRYGIIMHSLTGTDIAKPAASFF